jgi:hypothetical protein
MINYTPVGAIYPTLGDTLGERATGADAGPLPEQLATGTAPEVERALTIGGQASALVGFVVFALLAVGLMYTSRYLTPEKKPGSIKASALNALIIAAWAVAGIPVIKFLFTRFPVPGVSAWVHSV